MGTGYFLEEERKRIEKTGHDLFSGGTLEEKMRLAEQLEKLPGITHYSTAVPWKIVLPGGETNIGFSETLGKAAKDIFSCLQSMEKSRAPTTPLKIEVDTRRLNNKRLEF